jgi:hypothetical protein
MVKTYGFCTMILLGTNLLLIMVLGTGVVFKDVIHKINLYK